MRCGICTTDVKPASTDVIFRKIKGWGFECVQFSFVSVIESNFIEDGRIEIPWSVSPAAIDAIIRASEKYSLPIEAVNGTYNMAHPDKNVRDEGAARFVGFAEAAKALGAKYITLCSGSRNRENLWGYSPENNTADAWRDMADSMKRVVDIAEKLDMTLAIESEAGNIISTPEKARQIMDEIGSPRLKMIIDFANLFHAGEAYRENVRPTIKHAIDVFGHDIVIAHGKDIKEGDGIEFTGTGEGIVDFAYCAKLLNDIGYGGDMFLHGIYDEEKMVSAREHWLNAEKEALSI